MSGIAKLVWSEPSIPHDPVILKNPFCGFYRIYRFDVSSEYVQSYGTHKEENVLIEDCEPDPDMSIALVEINLKEYSESPLPDSALAIVRRVFDVFDGCGVQMILRFSYDWDGVNIQTEPKAIDTIYKHMEQLSPLLKEYEHSIYIIQGLFIGNWGEMHGSRYTKSNYLYQLIDKLKACVADSTYLSVRSPALWRLLSKSFDPPSSWNDAWLLRLGLFNDAMTSSEDDSGTYGMLHRAEVENFEDKMRREYEIKFQNTLCGFVPNGGEVIKKNPLNDFGNAVDTFKAMHVSYINSEYDQEVLDKWKDTVLNKNWGSWAGKTGYDYIAAHLGYRFCITQVKVSPDKSLSDHILVEITVRNSGFSICYRKLNVFLVIYSETDEETGEFEEQETEIPTDTRAWQPGIPVNLEGKIDISDWYGTTVRLAIRAEDPISGECVQFANTFYGADPDGNNLLGTFTATSK